ncbi:hypothetical protein V8C86DRAFT_2446326 [Haematococcus lacustris]
MIVRAVHCDVKEMCILSRDKLWPQPWLSWMVCLIAAVVQGQQRSSRRAGYKAACMMTFMHACILLRQGFKDAQDLQARYLAYASDPAACQGLDPRVMNRINAKLGRPLVYDPEAYSMRRNPLSTRTHLPIGVHWQKHKQGVISHLVVPPGKAGTGKRTIVCLRVHPATPEGIQEAMENHQRYRAYAEDQSQCAGLDPKVTCRIDTLLHRTPALEVPARIASLKHCRHTLARDLPKGVYRRSRVKGFVIAQLIIAGVKVKQTVYLGRFPDNPEGWKLAGESYLRYESRSGYSRVTIHG